MTLNATLTPLQKN